MAAEVGMSPSHLDPLRARNGSHCFEGTSSEVNNNGMAPKEGITMTNEQRSRVMAAAATADFGKFQKASYSENYSGDRYAKYQSPSTPSNNAPKTPSFHRPENFSYAKDTPKYGKPKRVGMAELLMGTARHPHVVVKRSKSPGRTMEAEEAIRLSSYPDGEPPKPGATMPMEREDFPAPPAQAIILPEILRNRCRRKQEQQQLAYGDSIFCSENSNDDDNSQLSPKVKREIEEMSKLHSPMAKIMLVELTEAPEKKVFDPRSSSRAPSAKGQLTVPTRFISSINASPSRSTDRPRMSSESAASKRRMTLPASAGSSPTAVCPAEIRHAPYGSGTRSATLPPPGTPGAFIYESFMDDDEDSEDAVSPAADAANGRSSPSTLSSLEKRLQYACSTGDADSVFERDSLYRWSSRSDCCSYTDHGNTSNFERSSLLRCSTMSDSVAVLRDLGHPKTPKKSTASVSDGMPFLNAATLDFRKRSQCALQMWEEQLFEPETTYLYDDVKITSANRRKGLDENKLEKYLSTVEFEHVLGITREEFYHLAEFKRNDLKRKVALF